MDSESQAETIQMKFIAASASDGLKKLREPFPEHQINKLPKPTSAQTDAVKKDFTKGVRCEICGSWHHPKVIHLDYVGHAALTDRLLDADPLWYWEPLAYRDGLPAFDGNGGLWIKLTVCGHTRIGYGNAEESAHKDIGAREKEVIGDALRNAAMRFGAALELWHKGDLHLPEEEKPQNPTYPPEHYPPEWEDGLRMDEASLYDMLAEGLDEKAAEWIESIEKEPQYKHALVSRMGKEEQLRLRRVWREKRKQQHPAKTVRMPSLDGNE